MKKIIPAAVAALLLTGSSAMAQSKTFNPHAYAAAMGGFTFGTETDATFGGEVGGKINNVIDVYGHFSRLQNTLPKYVNQQLSEVSSEISAETGLPFSFTAKAPAWLGMGGVRLSVPTNAKVRPYVLGGVGFGKARIKLTEADLGDVTNDLVSSGFFTSADLDVTKAAVEFGGGVQVPVHAWYLDAGYRFSKLLDAQDFNISRAYVGLGARF
jgi:opacity protein-like surface antigen